METPDHGVGLLPLGLASIEELYEIAFLGGGAPTWRTRGCTVPMATFASLLWDSGDATFAVLGQTAPGARTIVGHVGLYNHDLPSLTAHLAAFFDQRVANVDVIAGRALHLFASYVFQVVGLRKLCVEVPASRASYLHRATSWSTVLEHEGTLRDHVRLGRDYEDLELFAVWATTYAARLTEPSGPPPTGDPFRLVGDLIELIMETSCPDLTGGHRLSEDLDMDSLAVMELVERVEQAGGRPLDLNDLRSELTVQDVVELLEPSPGR